MKRTVIFTTQRFLGLLVAATACVFGPAAGASATTWDFIPSPVADTLLPHSQAFLATDGLTSLTASAFSYVTSPANATTDRNLFLSHLR